MTSVRTRVAATTAHMVEAGRTPPPRVVTVLLFLFGTAQFFVDPEPGLPEFLVPFLLLFTTQRGVLAPAHLLLFAGNIAAMVIEYFTFGTMAWSLVSLYLTLTSVALFSIMTRYDFYACGKALLLGGAFGSALTLAVLATPFASEAYRYGIRFTGFFKDPNVTAPTALFFAVALFAIHGRWKWAAILPFTVFAISLSRATYLAALVGLLFVLAFRNRLLAAFGTIVLAVSVLFLDQITLLIDAFFQSIGRQGLVNNYDNDRSSNWLELLAVHWESGVPLGPGFSEVNGMATHSTYLRLLVEQGLIVLIMFVAALVIAWSATDSIAIRAALLCVAVNGVVIDATHWRVLFVAIPLALAWNARRDRGGSRRTPRRRPRRSADPTESQPAVDLAGG